MASHKGLIVLVTAAGVLTLGIILGVLLLFPKDQGPVIAATTGEPNVFTLNVEPSQDASLEAPPEDVATEEAEPQNPLEVTPGTGLLPPNRPSPAPPSPVPSAPVAPPAVAPGQTPEWTRAAPPPVSRPPTEPVGRTGPARTAPARTPVPAPAATRPRYWIQIGAFRSHTQAETAAQRLETRGINGVISTVQSGSSILFRVRLGPWPSKAEADAFLGRVKTVEGYGSAFVIRTG